VTLRHAIGAFVPPRARALGRRRVAQLERRASIRAVPAGSSVVLGYHGVAEAAFDPWGLFLPPGLFAEHLEAIAKHFRPVSLAELAEAASRGAPIRRGVALTFDDGYRNLLEEARPALERFGIPATVFVVSGYVGSGKSFWWDALAPIAFSPRRPGAGSAQLDGVEVDWSLEPEALYRAVYDALQPLGHDRRSVLMDQLSTLAEPDIEKPHTMSADELRALADGDLVEIGSHTVTHSRLPDLEPALQVDELCRSRNALEQILARPVTSFAFPHGEFTPDAIARAREAGYTRVCTSVYASVRAWQDEYAIPRCFVYDKWHGDELAWQLSRYFRLGAGTPS
jgi:peptidoglycan/xylan/chitin deacetylase (PgdA/CDA1 family)